MTYVRLPHWNDDRRSSIGSGARPSVTQGTVPHEPASDMADEIQRAADHQRAAQRPRQVEGPVERGVDRRHRPGRGAPARSQVGGSMARVVSGHVGRDDRAHRGGRLDDRRASIIAATSLSRRIPSSSVAGPGDRCGLEVVHGGAASAARAGHVVRAVEEHVQTASLAPDPQARPGRTAAPAHVPGAPAGPASGWQPGRPDRGATSTSAIPASRSAVDDSQRDRRIGGLMSTQRGRDAAHPGRHARTVMPSRSMPMTSSGGVTRSGTSIRRARRRDDRQRITSRRPSPPGRRA